MNRRTLVILLAVSIVLLAGVSAVWALKTWERRYFEQFDILEAKRPYAPSGAFIAEADALAIADSAMTAAGYPPDQWIVHADDRSTAPNGRPDAHFVRWEGDPHSGQFMYVNATRNDWYCQLHVVLHREADYLRVSVSRGK